MDAITSRLAALDERWRCEVGETDDPPPALVRELWFERKRLLEAGDSIAQHVGEAVAAHEAERKRLQTESEQVAARQSGLCDTHCDVRHTPECEEATAALQATAKEWVEQVDEQLRTELKAQLDDALARHRETHADCVELHVPECEALKAEYQAALARWQEIPSGHELPEWELRNAAWQALRPFRTWPTPPSAAAEKQVGELDDDEFLVEVEFAHVVLDQYRALSDGSPQAQVARILLERPTHRARQVLALADAREEERLLDDVTVKLVGRVGRGDDATTCLYAVQGAGACTSVVISWTSADVAAAEAAGADDVVSVLTSDHARRRYLRQQANQHRAGAAALHIRVGQSPFQRDGPLGLIVEAIAAAARTS